MHKAALPLLIFCLTPLAPAQSFRVSTLAGFGTYSGDNGPATTALVEASAVAADSAGNVYVSDAVNNRIRKIDPTGTITTAAGLGYSVFSGDGGPAAAGGISSSSAVAVDQSGNLYFTDDANLRVREITTSGILRTVAGNGSCGTVTAGTVAVNASLCDVDSVAADSQGRVYFGSSGQVWLIGSDGKLNLIAGTGGTQSTGDGGPATAAQIGFPGSLAIDQTGILYIADQFNFVIRKVTPDKRISTVLTVTDNAASTIQLAVDSSNVLYYASGTSAIQKVVQNAPQVAVALQSPSDASCIAFGTGGSMYVCSDLTRRLLKINGDAVNSIAGAYPYAADPLPQQGKNVHLQFTPLDAGALAVDSTGNLYTVELDSNLLSRIDKLTPSGVLSTINPPGKLPGTNINFSAEAVAISPSGLVYFSTFTQVYRLELDGTITLVAGAPGFSAALGDGGPATAAKLAKPTALAFDKSGNLYIADPFDSRVRKVTPQNIISTFAGTGQAGYNGDGKLAINAALAAPVDMKFDSAGNLFIADVSASVVRKVDTNGIISTVAGTGKHGFSGDGGLATNADFSGPAAIAIDPAGNLFIADRNQAGATFVPVPDNNRIRMVNTAGIVSTVYGGFAGYNGEDVVGGLSASGGPYALSSDAQGNVYMAEYPAGRIRKLTPVVPPVVIQSVNTAGGYPDIAQNDWVEVRGSNLAPANLAFKDSIWSSAPEFATGKMPTQLSGVSMTVNGKPAFIYYVSPSQINALTPLDDTVGNVDIVVTNGAVSSQPFSVKTGAAAPSFLRFGASSYVVATHADNSLLGSPSLAVPGYPYVPAKAGETIVLYSVGFGLPGATLTSGSSSQLGVLPTQPVIKINGTPANVVYGGINGVPGLYQFNIVVPPDTPDGDMQITASYAGTSSLTSGITVSH